jgi:DNA-binding CsgD family transcriptional regulator
MNNVLIACLDSEPQEIPLATCLLLENTEKVTNVVVLHPIALSIAEVEQEFAAHVQWPRLTSHPLHIDAILKPLQFEIFTAALFKQIKQWLRAHYCIHLLLMSRCKATLMLGMSTAQLLLREEDRIWYLNPGDQAQLIRIRFACLMPTPTRFTRLIDSYSVEDACSKLENEQRRRIQYFITRTLTQHEYEVAYWLSKGMSKTEIARHLQKEETTVRNQITSIYRKLEIEFTLLSAPQIKREFLQQNMQKWLELYKPF